MLQQHKIWSFEPDVREEYKRHYKRSEKQPGINNLQVKQESQEQQLSTMDKTNDKTNDNLPLLKNQRGQLKATLTRAKSYFESLDKNNLTTIIVNQLQGRLQRIEPLLDEFNILQNQIEIISEISDDSERESFENAYFEITSQFKTIIDSNYSKRDNSGSCENTEGGRQCSSNTCGNEPPKVQLPTIHLPKFTGAYEQWMEFRDAFSSLIDKNNSISSSQKFYYLRSSLSGDALNTIQSIPVTEANYELAWKILEERYQNTSLIVHNHVKAIFEFPPITRENHVELRTLYDNINKNLRALKLLGQPTDSWDTLIIYIVTCKIDFLTKRAWESFPYQDKIPKMIDLANFLKQRCDYLERLHPQGNKATQSKYVKINKTNSLLSTSNNTYSCYYCKNAHSIYKCEEFVKLSPARRLEEIKKRSLCLNCLRPSHKTNQCNYSKCKTCQGCHNTLLHDENHKSKTSECSEQVTTVVNNHIVNNSSHLQVLLSTAVVQLVGDNGKTVKARALLDCGSQSNFISENICNLLNARKLKINYAISGVGQVTSGVSHKINIQLKSCNSHYKTNIACLVLKKITEPLPTEPFDTNYDIPNNVRLADATFNIQGDIDLLLGGGVFWDVVCSGKLSLGKGAPIMQNTKLGWIIGGNVVHEPQASPGNNSVNCLNVTTSNLLKRFWELEECSLDCKVMSEAEQFCEQQFLATHERGNDGRFIVNIPFKNNLVQQLGRSKQFAHDRFLKLENRLNNNPELKVQYNKFIKEYRNLGHMTKINLDNYHPSDGSYFLPHHPVFKESSLTTRLRIVFDGSMKTDTNLSLNDVQYSGPTIQNDIFTILLQFRQYQFVMTADISKMYRQVYIKDDQRKYQLIFWRENSGAPLDCYQLNTVTYGTSSASFLAIRSLHQLAIEFKEKYPLASTIIQNNFYVDDLLTGSNSVEGLITIQREISEILNAGGFQLRKYLCNDPTVLKYFKIDNNIDASIIPIGDSHKNKTLGVRWDAKSDTINFSTSHILFDRVITKRRILSIISQIFDPIGFLGPIVVRAKLILQSLWQSNTSWDEVIPDNIAKQWFEFCNDLTVINSIKIERKLFDFNCNYFELHAFSDASEKAYGTCIYIRYKANTGLYSTNLLCAKSKVAPTQRVSLPRLELCGALLLSNLVKRVRESLDVRFKGCFYWSDSTITLAWIKGCPTKWHTFVANRVSKIQAVTAKNDWYHITSENNPADLISRGISARELSTSELWWHIPQFLTFERPLWPSSHTNDFTGDCEIPEAKIVSNVVTKCNDFDLFVKHSKLTKLQRIVAYCLRFATILKKKTSNNQGPLTTDELDAAMKALIRISQIQSYPSDYLNLVNAKPIIKKSRLLSLNPYLDKDEIMRVGGRLRNSNYDKHPILLCPKHPLTRLIMVNEHIRLMHCGAQQLIYSIKDKYWPISCRNLAKGIIRQCITCFKAKPRETNYLMGNLPNARIQSYLPFINTGIDYAGPYLIKDRTTRGAKLIKAYICFFICLSTRAVHLDLVTDLTTDAFLCVLKRFIARRGRPSSIYSDNGTTFIGANTKIKEMYAYFKASASTIEQQMAEEGISWKFIPPRSPNFGGIWESNIKSTKFHLRRVIGNSTLNHEQFLTILIQVEGIMNSRPISPITNDPDDLTALSPSHFLIGRAITSLPERDVRAVQMNRLSQYQHVQKMVQHFWSRWQREYVSQLQTRGKWQQGTRATVQIGELVVLKDEGKHPLQWALGRITAVHPGADGHVRVVTVKTQAGTVKRAVNKVCILPLNDNAY